jgi:hypothetical protein
MRDILTHDTHITVPNITTNPYTLPVDNPVYNPVDSLNMTYPDNDKLLISEKASKYSKLA